MPEKTAPKTKSAKTPAKKPKVTKTAAAKTEPKKPAATKTVKKKTPAPKKTVAKTTTAKTPEKKSASRPKATVPPKNTQSQKTGFKSESSKQGKQESSKSSDWTKEIFDRFKKGLDEAYDAGMKLADKVGETAQEYTEKYKLQMEMRRFKSQRKEYITEIGEKVYQLYPTLGQASKVSGDKEIEKLYKGIQTLEGKIKKINDQLKAIDDDK